ncbi:MAG: alpha/beta hydrolase [Chloroflexota bacterium]|nr:alpha/beta hydrolase [Chloroflexota bacterium]
MAEDEAFVALRDGRRLTYAEYGRRRGSPAFYFHGTPGGLLEGRLLDEAARLQDVRLIAVDRPGYGRSDFKKDRRITDWPDDVADLADALEIDRFGVVGLSGGGPHAQACAAAMPERVTTAVIVSGAGSPEAHLDGRGRIGRFVTRAVLAMTPLLAWFAAMWAAFWAPRAREWMMPRSIDRAVMKRRDVREAFMEEVREALRPGGRAMAQDLVLFSRPWGFTPSDVGAVPVRLWHGDTDKVVPVSIGRYFSREIPGCQATFVAGGGHMMIIDHAAEIMAAIRDGART